MLSEKTQLVVESRTIMIEDDTNVYHESYVNTKALASAVKTMAVKTVKQTVALLVAVSVALTTEGLC